MMTGTPADRPSEAILVIDDERNILHAIQRQLHKRFNLAVAEDGEQGLALLRDQGPFAVVVCDMNMPGRTGIDVLAEVAEIAPDTVCIMLTGQADLATAMTAVNQGNIFRFFTKPCPAETLAAGLEAAIEQYRLVTAERDLLNKTLAGSIKVLTDVLALIDPDSFGRTERSRQWAREIAGALKLKRHLWKLEMATMLAPIGLAALPPEVAKKVRSNRDLSPVEQEMLEASAETAHKLICNIPRLQEVATYVLYQGKNVDGSGFPRDDKAGNDIPIGARIVRILNDLALSHDQGIEVRDALSIMKKERKVYDQRLLEAIAPILLRGQAAEADSGVSATKVPLSALQPGDVLMTPIADQETEDLILAKGTVITELYMNRLRNVGRIRKLTPAVVIQRSDQDLAVARTA